ncbi:hypothetical protein O6H91_19G039300 [Diphasiastrum complanatum]|uniref:Uncharacterized protein n=1 Tax=Diphasiastrum complanatum TaxID=34168 RepID=A0ACC2AUS1_DIPCM|nr:hypothetical protein O6H91_19G039300 [Diphasiastrum complanatum]
MERKKLSGKERKARRKEKKVVDECVKVAYSKDDHLTEFPAFLKYQQNGLDLKMESQKGDTLSPSLKQYIQALLKLNMEGPYGTEWPAEEKIKRREMVATEARYIIIRVTQGHDSGFSQDQYLWYGFGEPVVAFVQFRFVVEEDIPVLYVYELQLEKSVQGKGLGKFLMQLLELIARKNNMRAILLTVQKRNTLAMNFYKKLRYAVSKISPSKVDPLVGAEKSYEILCKAFDLEAKSKLEESLLQTN